MLISGMLISGLAKKLDHLMRNVTASVHNAVREGKLSFKVPTQAYLDRIEALGKPTGLNSIVIVNVRKWEMCNFKTKRKSV